MEIVLDLITARFLNELQVNIKRAIQIEPWERLGNPERNASNTIASPRVFADSAVVYLNTGLIGRRYGADSDLAQHVLMHAIAHELLHLEMAFEGFEETRNTAIKTADLDVCLLGGLLCDSVQHVELNWRHQKRGFPWAGATAPLEKMLFCLDEQMEFQDLVEGPIDESRKRSLAELFGKLMPPVRPETAGVVLRRVVALLGVENLFEIVHSELYSPR